MIDRSRSLFLLTLVSAFALVAMAPPRAATWLKGNTHTHSLWSDGDAAPEHIADWYKSHGYDFLVLSDHNVLLEGDKWAPIGKGPRKVPAAHVEDLVKRFGADAVQRRAKDGDAEMRLKTLAELRKSFEEEGRFFFIPGEEISDRLIQKSDGKSVTIPVHHNVLNPVHLVPPSGGASIREILENTMAAVKAEAEASGRPLLVHLNHPNFHWAVSPDDVAHVLSERFFEVYNGHRDVRNYGNLEHASMEQLWDRVLTLRLGTLKGGPLFALATDDAHGYHGDRPIANPGRGWVVVRAEARTAEAVVAAMLRGDFYASSGVALEDVQSNATSLTIKIAAVPGVSYTTRFIGTRNAERPGIVLQESLGASASYTFAGDELYVRATVISSRLHPNGYQEGDLESAWVQPVVLRR